MQDVVLALLAKEPSHGYQLRARLQLALGPLGEAMNARPGLRDADPAGEGGARRPRERADGLPDRPDRKVYALTAAGQQRVAEWLAEVELAEAGPGGVPSQAGRRRGGPAGRPGASSWTRSAASCCAGLREAQRAALAEPDGSGAGLLLEGVVLRLQADLRWLEACERDWIQGRRRS